MSPTERATNDNQNINVPTSLPMILKQFCKAAIRTQPYDLLKWSSAYFRALADGEEPPAKMRLEYPLRATESGLTLGYLKVLLRQLGDYNKTITMDVICYRWDCLCLSRKDFNLISLIGKFEHTCQVKKFLAIAVGLLTSSLFETMILICELFTLEPEGGSAMIPVTFFMEIYGYLAGLKCDGTEKSSLEEEVILTESKTKASTNIVRKTLDSVSMASQDTEADVNSDLESIPKDDSEHAIKSDISTNEEELMDRYSSPRQEKFSDTEDLHLEHMVTNIESFSRLKESVEEFSKNENISDTNKGSNAEKKKYSEQMEKNVESNKNSKFHPNVPGIGPKLLADEVAAVAVWLTECARRQNGMVGPRNLRHLLCPPLDRNHH